MKRSVLIMIVGLLACSMAGCGKDDGKKNEDNAPGIEIDNSAVEPETLLDQEPETEDEKEPVEKKDPVMENIALQYIRAINNYPTCQYGPEYTGYELVNISSSGYPQLVMIEEDNENFYYLAHLFSVNGDGNLVDLGENEMVGNFTRDYGFYEKTDRVARIVSNYGVECEEISVLNDNSLDYAWSFAGEPDEVVNDETRSGSDRGYYTSWIDENGQIQSSEHNKSYDECIEELHQWVGDGEFITFSEIDKKTRDDMIDHLKTFVSDDALTEDTTAVVELGDEAKSVYRKLINDIYEGNELIFDGADGLYYPEHSRDLYFALIDITNDGTPELFINPSSPDAPSWSVYTIKDGNYKRAELGESGYIQYFDPVDQKIYVMFAASEIQEVDVYSVEGGKIVFDCNLFEGDGEIYEQEGYFRKDKNGITEISDAEWNEFWASFEKGMTENHINGILLNEESFDKYFN